MNTFLARLPRVRVFSITLALAFVISSLAFGNAETHAATGPVHPKPTANSSHDVQTPPSHTPRQEPSFEKGPLRSQIGATAESHSPENAQVTPGNLSTAAIRSASVGAVGTASISGRLTSAPSQAVPGSMVYATSASGAEYWVFTNAQGRYTLSGLPAGKYTLNFDNSVKVVVNNLTRTENRTNVNAAVKLKSQFKGRVTNGITPVANVRVGLWSAADSNVMLGWVFTDSAGNYFVHGLAAGSYKLNFLTDYVTSGSYLSAYYDTQTNTFFSSTALSVGVNQITTVSDVSLSPAAEIDGTVTGPDGSPVAGVAVQAMGLTNQWEPVGWASSDASGNYAIRGLAHGRYRLQFVADVAAVTGSFRGAWYGVPDGLANSEDYAAVIALATAQVRTGLNQQLVAGGSISGKVSAPGKSGVAGVWLTLWNDSNEWVNNAVTNSAGNYVVRGLSPGSYRLSLDPSFVTSASYAIIGFERQPLIVVSGSSSVGGKNFTLTKAAQLSGKVVDSAGVGVPGVFINAVGPANFYDYKAWASTNSRGEFTMPGLTAGSFKIWADPSNQQAKSLNSRWSGNKSTYETATAYVLTMTQKKTGIVIKLTAAAQLAGAVTNSQGVGIPGVRAQLIDAASGEYRVQPAISNALGQYKILGVPPGSYKILFDTGGVNSGSYLTRYAGGDGSLAGATIVALTSGQTQTVSTTQLATGGTFEADIATSSTPVDNAEVQLLLADSAGNSAAATGHTDSLGHVKILGIPLGTYKVRVKTVEVTAESVQQFWAGGDSFNNATSYEITNTPAASHQLLAQQGGVIFGDIFDPDGLPIKGVDVAVSRADDTTTQIARGVTDSLGHFVIRGLPVGTYVAYADTVNVRAGSYVSQWLGPDGPATTDAAAGANAILGITDEVSAGEWRLTKGASISGNITSSTGRALADIVVTPVNASDETQEYQSSTTDSEGNYNLIGLRAGTYKLRFDTYRLSGQNLRTTWYPRKDSFDAAQAFTVAWGEQVTHQDGEVLEGAQVVGRVTAKSGGKAISGVTVMACPTQVGSVCGTAITNSLGKYTIRGLAPGTYRVNFDSTTSSGSYLPLLWSDKQTWDQATIVRFATRQVRTMNAQLVAAAIISGRITDGQGNGVANVQVLDYPSVGQETWLGAYAFTDEEGRYTLKGVPAGSVKLRFETGQVTGGTSYTSSWNSGKATWNLADVTNVPASSSRLTVDGVVLPTPTS